MDFKLTTVSSMCFTTIAVYFLPRRVKCRQHGGRSCHPLPGCPTAGRGRERREPQCLGFNSLCLSVFVEALQKLRQCLGERFPGPSNLGARNNPGTSQGGSAPVCRGVGTGQICLTSVPGWVGEEKKAPNRKA